MPFSLKSTPLVIAAAATLVAATGCSTLNQALTETQLQPGKCIVLEGESANNLGHQLVDCDPQAETAVYQIVLSGTGEQECEGDQEMYYTYESADSEEAVFSACMMPLFKADTCYAANEYDYMESACEESMFKVSEVFDTSDAECADADAVPLTYGSGNRTYCLSDPQA